MQTQNIQLSEILDTIEEMGDLSESAMEAARARQEVLAKPTGALGRLEDISIQLAGITGKVKNNMQKQAIVIMSADNGVVSEGVASAPQSVTLSQTINFTRHLTGVSSMAKYFGIDLLVIDVGVKMPIPEALYAPEMTEHVCADVCCQTGLTQKIVNRRIADGTKNLAKEPAMTEDEALRKGLEQLGMDRDDVSVSILERAKSGFLGIGATPARIRITYGPEDAPVAEEPVAAPRIIPEKPAEKPAEKIVQPKPAQPRQPRQEKPRQERPQPEKRPEAAAPAAPQYNPFTGQYM